MKTPRTNMEATAECFTVILAFLAFAAVAIVVEVAASSFRLFRKSK